MMLGQPWGMVQHPYLQDTPWLPVQTAASSRESRAKEETFMFNPGLAQLRQDGSSY